MRTVINILRFENINLICLTDDMLIFNSYCSWKCKMKLCRKTSSRRKPGNGNSIFVYRIPQISWNEITLRILGKGKSSVWKKISGSIKCLFDIRRLYLLDIVESWVSFIFNLRRIMGLVELCFKMKITKTQIANLSMFVLFAIVYAIQVELMYDYH